MSRYLIETRQSSAELDQSISRMFNRLVLTVTSKYPSNLGIKHYSNVNLNFSEKMAIELIRSRITPDELINNIVKNPPVVITLVERVESIKEVMIKPKKITVTYPTQDEIETSESPLKLTGVIEKKRYSKC